MAQSSAADALIETEVRKLERFYARATACHVIVERSHARGGREYQVRIDITVPGTEIAITHESPDLEAAHKDLGLAIRDAFRKAARQLRDYARRRRD